MEQLTIKAAFFTLGCKLNQAETDAIVDSFKKTGVQIVKWTQKADIYVLNSCTVTGKAEQKARRELRLVQKINPEASFFISGCYAEMAADSLSAKIPGVIVIPGSKKSALLTIAQKLAEAGKDGLNLPLEARHVAISALGLEPEPFAFFSQNIGFHSRLQLKVQDGCDRRCAYCRVCLARGPSISLGAEEVLRRCRLMEAKGIPELVLSGINLAQYKANGLDFPGLLKYLLENTDKIAFRLSSWEPEKVNTAFLEVFGRDRIRPHLHLAIQSGSDKVLSAMARPYRKDMVLKAVEDARSVRPEAFIGADIITGFPGESEEDFASTLDLVEKIRPAWLHVFTFSPRPGTKAFEMRPAVPERIAGERAKILDKMAKAGLRNYSASRLGKITEAVLEGSIKENCSGATSAEYLKLLVRNVPSAGMGACKCKISGLAHDVNGQHKYDAIADYIEQS